VSTERTGLWARRAFAALLLVPFVGTLVSGTCFYVSCYDDDDDDLDDDFDDDDDDFDCDDDDDDGATPAAIVAAEEASLRLERFRYALASTAGAHPMAWIGGIRGIRLPGRGTREFDTAALEDFTARVYEANRDMIGLPEASGGLVLEDIHFGERTIDVVWLQVPLAEAPAGRAPGRLLFRFNLVGRLRTIDNHTWLG
jgi:hypothetical protein